ncbi:hypothetical protein A9G43_03390 [Gilliamella sp. Occ3-1]|uniref:hypothetical protein n=1 Tax=Gilliamella sp. Occ3-1 TaxID=3120253 RepID=UPI00080D9669|nr:hypothetical protein [Gilliamella apicola]OCG71999.1 hypothetical protein A9G43_03390 [Gilliamella apicola]
MCGNYFLCVSYVYSTENYPRLIDDYKISHNPDVVDYHARVKCHLRGIVENCSMKIITNTGQVIKRDSLGGIKNNQVVTVASADDPSLVTLF